MIGLDTNILLRLVLQDDAAQTAQITAFLEQINRDGPAYVNCISLMEFAWFLRRRLKISRQQVMEAIADLLESQDLMVEDEHLVEETLGIMAQSNAEFADTFMALRNHHAGCTTTMTLDKQAARTIKHMDLLP